MPIRMLTTCFVALALIGAETAAAQSPSSAPAEAPPVLVGGGEPAGKLPPAEIQKLVAPIALYPDVLIAQILPAATFPMDVIKAARWLRSKPDMNKLLEQEWDPSVLSLSHYPDVIYMLDKDIDWMNNLGAAFLDQQDDVMNAIQDLRAKAQAGGVLETNKQQTVVVEEEKIIIVPSEPETVYIPQYNPQVIYIDDDDDDDYAVAASATSAAIGFTAGLALGAWLDMDCDWHHHHVAFCSAGYWGGYGHIHGYGRVAWGNDWAAAVGPRRAAVVGEHGGAYVGPRGAAVWGENGHGAAWRRGSPVARPHYSNNYAGYGVRTNNVASNRQAFSNNRQTNINNINVDRGNTNIGSGNRNNIGSGNRGNAGNVNRGDVGSGNRGNLTRPGDRPGTGGAANRPSATPARGQSSSAFSRPTNSSASRQAASRGASSRSNYSGSANRGASGRSSAQPSRSSYSGSGSGGSRSSGSSRSGYSSSGRSSSGSSSAFRSSGSSSRSSSRGSASRGASRGGGGRGGRR